MLNTVGRFIYTKYRGILCVEHCGKIYLHKILGNTLCWVLWEYLFTQHTEEYFMLNRVGRFIYIKYWGILYVEHWEDLFTQNTEEYCMLSTVGRFIYTKYWTLWEDLFTQNTEEYCTLNIEKIYLHKILRNTIRWTPWGDLFTQNSEE